MQFASVLLGFAAVAAAQTFTGATISATGAAPAGCTGTYDGTFELSVAVANAKRAESNALLVTLKDGLLMDNMGRIGYIASNYQFQFDFGGQAGQLINAGFSVCSNDSLALGNSAVWYECLSGTFYNLYDKNWAPQCKAVYLQIIPQSGEASFTGSAIAYTSTAAASSSAATSASAYTSSVAVVTSISDGQPQGPTSTSATVVGPTGGTATSVAIVTTISDGQPQGPTKTSVLPYTGAASMPTVAAQVVLAVAGAAIAML